MPLKNDDKIQLIMPSLITEDAYANLELRSQKEFNTLPVAHTNEETGEEVFLSLKFDDDYDYLKKNVISEFDEKVLVFICKFRFVQKLHIINEFPEAGGKRLERSLKRLMTYHLIGKWEYDRIDENGDEAKGETFFTKSAGDIYLTIHHLFSSDDMLHWTRRIEQNSARKVVRYWKVCDTYQYLKLNKNFLNYNANYVCNETTLPIKIKNKDKGSRIVYKKLDYFRMFGSALMKTVRNSKNVYYSYVLYPIVDNNDVDSLRTPLMHWGVYKEEWKNSDQVTFESKPRKFLTVICNNRDTIDKIIKKYDAKTLKVDLLFVNLEDISENDVRKGVYVINPKSPDIELFNFKFELTEEV